MYFLLFFFLTTLVPLNPIVVYLTSLSLENENKKILMAGPLYLSPYGKCPTSECSVSMKRRQLCGWRSVNLAAHFPSTSMVENFFSEFKYFGLEIKTHSIYCVILRNILLLLWFVFLNFKFKKLLKN